MAAPQQAATPEEGVPVTGVGCQFCPAAKELRPGDEVKFCPRPHQLDRNAVMIMNTAGKKIGNVAKEETAQFRHRQEVSGYFLGFGVTAGTEKPREMAVMAFL